MADQLSHHHAHYPAVGQLPAAHGPDTGTDHVHLRRAGGATREEEHAIFSYLTHPDDNYTASGVYWADLPFWQRLSFVNQANKAETNKELSAVWTSVKRDPLSPVGWYLRNAVLPGAGIGLEGYVLFSIGNLSSLFAAVWPTCWGNQPSTCDADWVAAVTYLEVVGIMIGQLLVGIIGDWVGRRWGLIQDATIMFGGLVMLAASWGRDLQGWVVCYAWSLFFYSIGVGGEYPITATSSMENAAASGKVASRDDRLHRGRKVVSAFLMQGWGQLVNQALLLFLLLVFEHGDGPSSTTAAQWIFRLSFVVPAIGSLWLIYYRTYKMHAVNRQLALTKKKHAVTGYDIGSLRLVFGQYGGRVVATAGAWFANDVFFYGNKLFQSQFIKVITDNNKSIAVGWVWNLYNIVAGLVGYYLASILIDNRLYGRKTMQQVGFLVCLVCFAVPAFNYEHYSSKDGIHAFQAMYYLSSFFNQFGPNCVTFLVAAEVFPTPIRATAHGFSAMVGKAGALLASVLYNYIDVQTRFYVVPWFGLAGMVLTFLFLPDTTGLDLKEQERWWEYIRTGRADQYHGIAIHPIHLSFWEWVRGGSRHYDPELDRKAKIEDLREEWFDKERSRAVAERADNDDDDFSADVHRYFQATTSKEQLRKPDASGRKSAMGGSDAVLSVDENVV